MNIRFDGKKVWITGGAGGIGQAIAGAYLEAGAEVVLLDVHADKLALASESLGQEHIDIQVINLSDPDEVRDMVAKRNEEIDVLVNAAGLMSTCGMEEMDEKQWDAMFSVNVKGSFFLSQAVSQGHLRRGGSIVLFSSAAAIRAFKGNMASPHYAASKGALISLARQMAADLGDQDINVNAIVPGGVLTPAMKAMGFDNEMMDTIPLKRLCLPEEVANTVLFLTSKEGHMIDGQAIVMDGGANIIGQ